jgi:uncharacterized SAM-binding protein YcdF (DUF218 family)
MVKNFCRSRVALGLLLLILVWYSSLLVQVHTYSSVSYSSPADASVVLGAAVWESYPSPVFEERIKHAIDLYQAGDVQAIVFTGGVGEGEQLAESEVAKEYAIKRGVSAEHIYCETVSRITYENLKEAKKIIDRQGFRHVLIVSDPLHMKRAVTIARDLGIDAYPSPTPTSQYQTWRSKLGFLLREACFYAGYLLRRPFIRNST